MAKKARTKSNKNIYHVFMRGNNKQVIFYEDYDYRMFLKILRKFQEELSFKIFAYCLMDNHIHLLISPAEMLLGDIVQRICISFVHWYNLKYQRQGHLFQGTFESVAIESDASFKNEVRYIVRNPLKPDLVTDPMDYPWSSAKAYYIKPDPMVDSETVLEKFKTVEHLKERIYDDKSKLETALHKTKRISNDAEALPIILEVSGCNTPYEFLQLDKDDLRKYIWTLNKTHRISIRRLQRLTGVPKTTIERILREKKNEENKLEKQK